MKKRAPATPAGLRAELVDVLASVAAQYERLSGRVDERFRALAAGEAVTLPDYLVAGLGGIPLRYRTPAGWTRLEADGSFGPVQAPSGALDSPHR